MEKYNTPAYLIALSKKVSGKNAGKNMDKVWEDPYAFDDSDDMKKNLKKMKINIFFI